MIRSFCNLFLFHVVYNFFFFFFFHKKCLLFLPVSFRLHTEIVGPSNYRWAYNFTLIHGCGIVAWPTLRSVPSLRAEMKFDPVDVCCKCALLGEAACWHEAKCCYSACLVWHFHNVRQLMKDQLEKNVCD